jgi:hypothetical protein
VTDVRCAVSVECIAVIAEHDYETFKTVLTTTIPRDYEMWLRVRERGKLRAFRERAAVLTEIEVSPDEFVAYCEGLRRPDFSIATLDRCARAKSVQTRGAGPAVARRAAG